MEPEIWDLFDASGRKTGRTMRRGEEVPAGLYHLGVHIWPVNSRGEWLIQQRAATVQWKPNLWAVTGGSAVSGEDAMTAARRELREELGYDAAECEMQQIACLRRTNSFCNVFIIRIDCPAESFSLQKEEVRAVRWCDRQTLMRMVADNVMYNYGDAYFKMLFSGVHAHGMSAHRAAQSQKGSDDR